MKLQIKVIPSSSQDCIAGWLDDSLKIKVRAQPEKGKANKAIIKILEKSLSLEKGSIVIESGLTSSRKIISIECTDEAIINKKIADICNL